MTLLLTDFPTEILEHILIFCNDISTLQNVALSHPLFRTSVYESTTLWSHFNVTMLSEEQQSQYKETPMNFTREWFQRLFFTFENLATSPRTRALVKEHREHSLTYVLTMAVENGHLGLARYAYSLRQKSTFLDDYVASRLLRCTYNIIQSIIAGTIVLNDTLKRSLQWIIDTADQKSYHSTKDQIVFVNGIDRVFHAAIRLSLQHGFFDIAEMLLKGVNDPTVQLGKHVAEASDYEHCGHLLKQSPMISTQWVWMHMTRYTLYSPSTSEHEQRTANILFRYLPVPSDDKDLITLLEQCVAERKWSYLAEVLQHEYVLPKHITIRSEDVPIEIRELLQCVLMRQNNNIN